MRVAKGRLLDGLVVCIVLLVLPLGELEAGWSKGERGITHVPIAPLQTRTQLGSGVSISHFDVEGPIPAEELEVLKQHPPFEGKSDAEILAKMNAIRRNVVRAIDALLVEDPELHYCLIRTFFGRRLCLEFSSRKISGAVNANQFSGKDACELGGIAIKNPPCSPKEIYEGDMISLMSTLAHEGLHLGQEWPPALMPTRIKGTVKDIGQRIQFQQNEIDASSAEKKRLENILQVFQWMRYHNGEVPPDDEKNGFKKLPLTLSIVKKFQKEVPAAERAAKAGEISSNLAIVLVDQVCLTLECRKAVKAALDNLLVDVREDPGDFRAAVKKYQKAIGDSRAASGWYKQLKGALFNGLFKTDIFAGGLGDQTNTIRQFFAGESREVSIPLDYVSDVLVLDETRLLVVGASEGEDTGSIYQFDDSDGDGFLDQGSMTVRLSHMYLAGSNRFCRGGDGALYILNRGTLMFFRLGETAPTFGIEYQGTIGDPDLDDIGYVAVSNDGLDVVGYPFEDSALFPNLGWVKSSRPSTGSFFGSSAPYGWMMEAAFSPVITVWPQAGDMSIHATGTPGSQYEVGAYFGEEMQTIVSGTFDAEGRAEAVAMVPFGGGDRLVVGPPGGPYCFPLQVPSPYDLRSTRTILPVAGELGLPGTRSDFKIGVESCPGAVVWGMQIDFRGLIEPAGTRQVDGYGRAFFEFDVGYDPELKWHGGAQFKVMVGSELTVRDETVCIPPGVLSTVDVANNDEFPSGTTYVLTSEAPVHHDIFKFTSDGRIEIAPLTTESSLTVSYRATTPDGDSADGVATIEVDRSKLCSGPLAVAEGEGGGLVYGVRIPCLVLGEGDEKRTYPMYQFLLTNSPLDICKNPHWHTHGRVFSLDEMDGITDPEGGGCGFGTWIKVERIDVVIPEAEWEGFKERHPL